MPLPRLLSAPKVAPCALTYFACVTDTKGVEKVGKWPVVLGDFTRPAKFRGNEAHGLFAAVRFNGDRRAVNVVQVFALVADHDRGKLTVEGARQLYPYLGVAHTTRRSRSIEPRVRVILPYSRAVTPEEQKAIWRRMAARAAANGTPMDPLTKDVGHFFYVPGSLYPDEHEAALLSGDPLDVDALLAEPDPGTELNKPRSLLADAPGSGPVSIDAVSRHERIRRARAYAARIPPSIAGEGGDNQLHDAALKVRRGFDLSDEEAINVLWEVYNPRCVPPWDSARIVYKVGQAAVATSVGSGWLLDKAPPLSVGAGSVPFPTKRIADVEEQSEVPWLVEGLWGDEAVGVFGGEPKSHKSFFAVHMAVCIAAGLPVLGRHATRRGTVLAFNAEDGASLTRRRVERMCLALNLSIDELDLHMIDVPTMRLDDATQLQSLDATIAVIKPVFVLLDPLRNLHSGDEDNARDMARLLDPFRVMQRKHRCAVGIVHHMTKAGPQKKRLGQRLRGSSVLHGWLDSALYFERDGQTGPATVTAEHRAAASPDPFAFRLVEDPAAGGASSDPLALEVVGAAGEVVMDQHDDAAIAALRSTPGLSGNALQEALKLKRPLCQELVRRLAKEGRIEERDTERTSKDGRRKKTRGWFATEAQS